MSNYLYLKDLEYKCILGVYPEEREAPQPVIINAKIFFDIEKFGISDDLQDTLCYVALHRTIEQVLLAKQYNLIEHIAHSVIQKLKENYGVIEKVQVSVEKIQIPDNRFSGRIIAHMEG